MPEYIDREKIDFRLPYFTDENGDVLVSLKTVKRCIAMTPTEDVVAVVRCKDCKHKCGIGCPFYDGVNKSDNDFCSYGERTIQYDD